jgi:EpsI family protein
MTDGFSKRASDVPTSLDRRGFVMGAAMAGAAAFAAVRMPQVVAKPIAKDKFAALFPAKIGKWAYQSAGDLILPPSDALSDRLYDDLVTRTYADAEGGIVQLLVAYNNRQDGILQLHRPETCYPAGGFKISQTQETEVPVASSLQLPCMYFTASGDSRDETVMYWSRVGAEFPRRWSEQRLAVARANLDKVIPDGLLARLSTVGEDVELNLPIMREFVVAMAAAAPPQLRRLLFASELKV